MKAMFLAVLAAIAAMSFSLSAQASVTYGQLTGIPADGTITYLTWGKSELFPPQEVLTEDGFNSPLGLNQGYQKGYFLIEPENFTGNSITGDGVIYLTGIALELGKATKDTPYKWGTGNPNDDNLGILDFSPSDRPLPPNQPKTVFLKRLGRVGIFWESSPASSFLIYRSSLPSGAENGHSNGRYQLVGQTKRNWFLDKNLVLTSVWYIIVGVNEKMGGHSEESGELSLKGASAAPQKSVRSPVLWGKMKNK